MLDVKVKPKERSPTLDTILMIEKHIEENSSEMTKTELWKTLPKKVMYGPYKKAIDYLEQSSKIYIDSNSFVVWIYDPDIEEKIKGLTQV